MVIVSLGLPNSVPLDSIFRTTSMPTRKYRTVRNQDMFIGKKNMTNDQDRYIRCSVHLKLHQLLTCSHFAKDAMLAVQPRSLASADEELAAIRVGP